MRNTVKEVRVVTIGDYSVELCGGTHVGNTSEIGLFKIVKEEGIGSGTRRILAVTGKEAFEAYREQEDALKAVAATLKAPQLKEVPHKVEGLKSNSVNCKRKCRVERKAAAAAAGDVFKDVKEVNGHRYIASQVSVSDAGALRTFADNWKQKKTTLMSLFLSQLLVTRSTSLLQARQKISMQVTWLKELAPIVDGRGGGKPDMAMAGGSNQAKIQELLDAVAGKL